MGWSENLGEHPKSPFFLSFDGHLGSIRHFPTTIWWTLPEGWRVCFWMAQRSLVRPRLCKMNWWFLMLLLFMPENWIMDFNHQLLEWNILWWGESSSSFPSSQLGSFRLGVRSGRCSWSVAHPRCFFGLRSLQFVSGVPATNSEEPALQRRICSIGINWPSPEWGWAPNIQWVSNVFHHQIQSPALSPAQTLQTVEVWGDMVLLSGLFRTQGWGPGWSHEVRCRFPGGLGCFNDSQIFQTRFLEYRI